MSALVNETSGETPIAIDQLKITEVEDENSTRPAEETSTRVPEIVSRLLSDFMWVPNAHIHALVGRCRTCPKPLSAASWRISLSAASPTCGS
jgi:hypothetical protein